MVDTIEDTDTETEKKHNKIELSENKMRLPDSQVNEKND